MKYFLPASLLLTLVLSIVPRALASGTEGNAPVAANEIQHWVAFVIVATSLITAWLLNYSAPKVRAFGTFLSGLGCLAIVVWFVYMLDAGVMADPRPGRVLADAPKPLIMWTQISVALLAGIALLFIAIRQSKSSEVLELSKENEVDRYGKASRFLHWAIAIFMISLIPIGIFTTMIPEDAPFRLQYYKFHKTIGVVVFALVLIRLFWNRLSKRPVLDPSLTPTERKMAHAAHFGLYFFMIAMPLTGYIMTSFHGYPLFFFAWELQPLWGESETGTMLWGMTHKYVLPYLLYVVLGAHILGALKHHFIDKHASAFKRMVS